MTEGAGGGAVLGLAARAGMTGECALSWIPACAGMTGRAALAPLTAHDAPYRHPRESGGPDGRHGHLPVAPPSRPRAVAEEDWAAEAQGAVVTEWARRCNGQRRAKRTGLRFDAVGAVG